MKKPKTLRIKRHRRFLEKISGTKERPRLKLMRSHKNLSAQIIDDASEKTLFSLSTLNKDLRQQFPSAGNIKSAESFGVLFAQKAKEKGITKVVLDRCGFLYHGRVKAFADALRKGGLEF